MRTVSSRFAETIGGSYLSATKAVVLTEDGSVDLSIVDGTVSLDSTAASRGRFDLTIAGDELVPTDATDLLAPYGNEIQLFRGVQFSDGTTELVSLGVFRIEDCEITDSADGFSIQLSGNDRSARIIDAQFEDTYTVAVSTNCADAILAAIQDAYPTVDYNLSTTSLTLPALIADAGSDRWDFCQGIAEACGMVLYFNGDGVLRLKPAPVIGTPVLSISEGEGGVLIALNRSWRREGAFNAVIASGENTTGTGGPARGTAYDLDSESPAYYHGRFGHVPRFYSSEYILTDDQATLVAQTILDKEKGTSQSLTFDSLVNPALEPGDVVHVDRLRSGVSEDHILDSVSIPLAPVGAMSGATRAVTSL